MAKTKNRRSRDGLFKRGNSKNWQCWVRGERLSTGTSDRQAALLVKAKLERAAADPAYHAAHEATVRVVLAEFIKNFATRDRSPETLKMHKIHCRHIARLFGDETKMADVGARQVDMYVETRLAESATRSTVGKELSTMRGVLRLAKRHGRYPFALDDVMPIGFSIDYKPRSRALTWAEFGALVVEVAKYHPHHAGMVVFFVAAAVRKGEAERAHGEDIDWERGIIKVRGTKTDLSADEVPIADAFRPLLEFTVPRTNGLLWGVWHNMTRDLAAACKRLGIERVTANDLRRSHATLLRRAGAAPQLIARMLRHADSRMVERVYGRLPAADAGRLLTVQIQHSDVLASQDSLCPGTELNRRHVDFQSNPASPGSDELAETKAETLSPGSSVSADSGELSDRNSTAAEVFRALSLAWFRRAA